ncbi:MAG TPA: hypothetical protein VKC53_03095 [Patescibacteria group bacterium]|nr:hypothetical protein [Patescibacteria group bacterium]
MRSAQRKKRIENSKTKSRVFGLLIKVVIPVALILLLLLVIKLNTKYWNGHDKLSFVTNNPDGTVLVTVLDPLLNEETNLVIPGDTEVNVARGYGTLRIKNVWQLGLNEKLGGGLLAQTLTESFLFPTNLWSDHGSDNTLNFIFKTKNTNIPFGDRLFAGLFALKIKAANKTDIDLAKSQFLHKEVLTDGKPGYVIMGTINSRLTIYFSDNNMSDTATGKNLKFSLTDATGKSGVAGNVGQILEVLGGKVVAIDKVAKDDSLDCEVNGSNNYAVKKVADLFSCRKIMGNGSFDLELRLGAKFAKRF